MRDYLSSGLLHGGERVQGMCEWVFPVLQRGHLHRLGGWESGQHSMGAIPAIMDSHNLGRSGPADHVSQEMSDQPQNGSGGVDDAAAAV